MIYYAYIERSIIIYLVPSDHKLLATLKLVQGNPEDFLAIDFPNSDVYHSYNYTRSSIESAFHSERKVHIDMTEGELLYWFSSMRL